MRLAVVRVLLLLAIGAARLCAQALNPFEMNFEEQLTTLKERVYFYSNNYPDLTIPEELLPSKLAALGAGGPAANTAQRKLKGLVDRLDRVALGFLKKELHAQGTRVPSDPTNSANFQRRLFIITEFVTIMKRQRIPAQVYFAKGDRELAALKLGGDDAYRAADALLLQLAGRLKEEIEGKATPGAAGGGGGVGGGGGYAGGGGGDGVVTGSGGLSGFEESPAAVRPQPTRRPVPSSENEPSWISTFKTIVGVGVVAVVVCSLLALLLPRVRAGMFAVFRRMANTKGGPDPLADDDAVKKALVALNRGDYRKALSVLEKITSPMKQPEVVYHKAVCYIRLLQVEDASRQLTLLELDRTGLDEIFRLASACEEARMVEWAIRLYEHLQTRDAHFRGVAGKIERLKSGG